MSRNTFLAIVAALLCGVTIAAAKSHDAISETAMTGPYTVTLKVLPAESFTGPKTEMAWDAGAKPVALNSPERPNHHVVAFVTLDRRPVEQATVTIRYREIEPQKSPWTTLPVARMHVAGENLDTTHFGNNVKLGPGRYAVEVSVDGTEPATLLFTLPATDSARAG
jgi:hypothetical protein